MAPSSGGVFVPDHPHCHSTAFVVFSLYTGRDIDSDDSHARPLVHACAQPTVWFEREGKLRAGRRADTRQRKTGSSKKIAQDIAENLRNYEESVAKKQIGPDS